ncbi:MAG: sugar phosphate isomerase/epimerase [Acidobacteria bacterium]|nr:sugar phosphate isomerase/epimerase [Acidobacteriota bacterium]
MTNGSKPLSRREFAAMAALTIPGLTVLRAFALEHPSTGAPEHLFAPVTIGAITYSFRSIPDVNAIIAAMKQMGLTEAEVMSNHIEQLAGAPAIARGASRDPLLEWRKNATAATFAPAKKAFTDAGIDLRFLTYNMNRNTTPEEMEYAFAMAKALGVKAITTSTQVSVAEKIAPLADKHKMIVAYHGHDSTNPDEFATPESFAKAMAMSKYHYVNLDLGHFTASNYDAVAYLKEHHARITNLHIKDRKKDHGPNVPWGQGDTPIKEVLLLLKKEGWDIPANIEFEYPGDAITEVTKCVQFCKDVLK